MVSLIQLYRAKRLIEISWASPTYGYHLVGEAYSHTENRCLFKAIDVEHQCVPHIV